MFRLDYTQVEEVRTGVEKAIKTLKPFEGLIPLNSLIEAGKDFEEKIRDFEERDKKLRVGIIGQVKAGKSSFVNSLFFKGEEILPRAATPKTANLTILRYGEDYALEVEFFKPEEFEGLLKLAESKEETEEVRLAQEIKERCQNFDFDYRSVLAEGKRKIKVSSLKEFEGVLNDYAGEGGRFTPLVKSLVLYIPDKRLMDMEIIDTPGLNDPVIYRTQKTRELMKKADVVFFLSLCSQFLDKTDLELLACQLPSEGVRKFVLIGSKFDSALIDAGWDNELPFEETLATLKKDLTRRAEEELNKYLEKFNLGMKDVVKSALPPIFISSFIYNLLIKEEPSPEEEEVWNELQDIWEELEMKKEVLEELANFKPVQEILEKIIKEKEKILEEKLCSLIPLGKENYQRVLKSYLREVEKNIKLLRNKDIEHLLAQKKIFEENKYRIVSAIKGIVDEVKQELEREKNDFIAFCREALKKAQQIRERTGTEVRTSERWVSTSKWYKPWTWGTGYYKTETTTITYKYFLASDAVENLINYANESASRIEKAFNKILDSRKIKLNLKKVLIDVIDTSSEDYSPEYCRYAVEQAVEIIYIPKIKISVDDLTTKITSRFQGEIKRSEMDTLKRTLQECLMILYEKFEEKVEEETKNVFEKLKEIENSLLQNLTDKISEDIKKFEEMLKERETQLKKHEELRNVLNKLLEANQE